MCRWGLYSRFQLKWCVHRDEQETFKKLFGSNQLNDQNSKTSHSWSPLVVSLFKVQCAAVRTYCSEIKDPPQWKRTELLNTSSLYLIKAIHGNSRRFALAPFKILFVWDNPHFLLFNSFKLFFLQQTSIFNIKKCVMSECSLKIIAKFLSPYWACIHKLLAFERTPYRWHQCLWILHILRMADILHFHCNIQLNSGSIILIFYTSQIHSLSCGLQTDPSEIKHMAARITASFIMSSKFVLSFNHF